MKYIKRFERVTFSDFHSKNSWVVLSNIELKELRHEIWELVDISYGPLGGHVRIKDKKSILSDKDLKFWRAADIDNDPKCDVVIFARKSNGYKISGWGHDGSKEARTYLMKELRRLLSVKGLWIEVSGRPAELLIKNGCIPTKDVNIINKLFNTEVNYHEDGSYTRELEDGSITDTEFLLGRPIL